MTVKAASPQSAMSPFLKLGPQAALSGVPGPNYGLFTCQVVGLDPGPTCYDPHQIRHAYHTDLLINAGFKGKGKTIVIIDAFQSPNIVQEVNEYNAFYGLPGLNGLGGLPPDLGTFTQLAPDGLTPFVLGDPNMTNWPRRSRRTFCGRTPSRPGPTSLWFWQNRMPMPIS